MGRCHAYFDLLPDALRAVAAGDEVLLRATGCCRPDEQSSLAAAAAARVRGAAANYTLPFVPP